MNESTFRMQDFRPVTASDRAVLESALLRSPEESCEFSFANLCHWSFVYRNFFQQFRGVTCFWMQTSDTLILAETPGRMTIQDCVEISQAMRAEGYSGVLSHIREETLRRLPELERYFHAELMPEEFGEYIYDVEALAELKGEKYSAKRNLISQFKRAYPDHRLHIGLTPALADACLELAETWRAAQDDPDSEDLVHETEALKHAFADCEKEGLQGLSLLVQDRVAAFSMVAPISSGIWCEPFEKADHRFKGASQLITVETARFLTGKCRFLNREQDLGKSGMRQAKRSFHPVRFLRNYALTPRSGVL